MRVSTQVQVSSKEICDAVIEAARKVAGIETPGSASVKFYTDTTAAPVTEQINTAAFSAVVEFVKAGHS